MSTKTTEGLAADISECARVEDAARAQYDAAVIGLEHAKKALSVARLATEDAIEAWRKVGKKDQLTTPVVVGSARGRSRSISTWVLDALGREASRVFMAEELVVAIKNIGHDVDVDSMRSALGRLVGRGEIQRVGRGLYRANAGAS